MVVLCQVGNMKDKYTFKEILNIIEYRSTCARLHVGALIVKDGRILSTGWNGVLKGLKHCNEIFTNIDKQLDEHHRFSEENEIHAEMNAIAFASRNGVSLNGAEIYTSISPCSNCAKLIVASGIKKVYYKTVYNRSTAGLDFLNDCVKKNIIETVEKLDA